MNCLRSLCLSAAVLIPVAAAAQDPSHALTPPSRPKVRTYYIAADEVDWDYAPSGINRITGEPFDEEARVFVARGPQRIGRVYRKSLYREYTDAGFTTLKPREAKWEHLGLVGPVVRAEVGDTIRFVFKNHTTLPQSVHPHGVFYTKSSEGTPYDDGTAGADKADDKVLPGAVYTYEWPVPERAGPGPMDPSSVLWMYHGHIQETKDTNSGLIGPIIVTARGKARPDGTPVDVDQEVVLLYTIFDENDSHYLQYNIEHFAGDPRSVDKENEGFKKSNQKHAINGLLYGNLPMLELKQGSRVRWYLMAMGDETDLHTPHWHGNTTLSNGMRTDVVELMPMSMKIADMTPDNPGIWLHHCHVNEHLKAGMQARYRVVP